MSNSDFSSFIKSNPDTATLRYDEYTFAVVDKKVVVILSEPGDLPDGHSRSIQKGDEFSVRVGANVMDSEVTLNGVKTDRVKSVIISLDAAESYIKYTATFLVVRKRKEVNNG